MRTKCVQNADHTRIYFRTSADDADLWIADVWVGTNHIASTNLDKLTQTLVFINVFHLIENITSITTLTMTDTRTIVPVAPKNAFEFAVSAAPHTACPSLPTFASKFDLLATQWSSISEDNNGVATSIFGIELEEFSSKQRRVTCSKLYFKGSRNATKWSAL